MYRQSGPGPRGTGPSLRKSLGATGPSLGRTVLTHQHVSALHEAVESHERMGYLVKLVKNHVNPASHDVSRAVYASFLAVSA